MPLGDVPFVSIFIELTKPQKTIYASFNLNIAVSGVRFYQFSMSPKLNVNFNQISNVQITAETEKAVAKAIV